MSARGVTERGLVRVDANEAVIVRTIFDLYTRDRLGSRNIATVLDERGHRTTTGGHWSAHQIVRALNNRIYLGELTFRDNTVRHPRTDGHRRHLDRSRNTARRLRRSPRPPRRVRLRLSTHRPHALSQVRQSHARHPRHRPQPPP